MSINSKLINHVALVLDASPSMSGLTSTVIQVADAQVKFLAELSQQLDQETRITIYTFANHDLIDCIVYDTDVLRVPTMQGQYRTYGSHTALVDATLKSQEDLEKTATLYGQHAFLTFVLTDGCDNNSRRKAAELTALLKSQSDQWTMAAMVPDVNSKLMALKYGFLPTNVAIWDTTSRQGLEEAGEQIRNATANYMHSRAAGVTTKNLSFDMSTATVNHKTVGQLREIVSGVEILPVKAAMDITTFITVQHKRTFRQGKYYFPLVKREKVGPRKNVVIRHKVSGKIYGGPEVRQLLGLPDNEVSIKPGINDQYDVFVQSTSTNRNLIPGHDLLVIE